MSTTSPLRDAVKKVGRGARRVLDGQRLVVRALDDVKVLAAEPAVQRIRALGPIADLRDAELRVFSQFGDDGIIQYLVHRLPGIVDTFVEFGVADYREANTRYLLVRDNWRGLVMDGSAENVAAIEADDVAWRHDLEVRSAFVTRENIDALLREGGVEGRIGLLHIDIDGNDYWVWEALTAVAPDVVVIEYNAVFGARAAVSVPYDPAFQRARAHASWLYWGASLGALVGLGRRKGYRFVGCNGAGNNAYFVRAALAAEAGLPDPGLPAGFVDSRFRESRASDGRLSRLRGPARRQAIEDMDVVDVELGRKVKIRDLPP